MRCCLLVLVVSLATGELELPGLPAAAAVPGEQATVPAPTPAPTLPHNSIYHRLQVVQEHLGLAPPNRTMARSPHWWHVRCDNLAQRLRPVAGSPDAAQLTLDDGTTVPAAVHRRSPHDKKQVWAELALLEHLRGRYGVPELLGACVSADQALVVTKSKCPARWDEAMSLDVITDKKSALQLAWSWVKLFQGVSEFGHAFVADLQRSSFCVDRASGFAVSLVDVRPLVLLDGSLPVSHEMAPVLDVVARKHKACQKGCGQTPAFHRAGCGRPNQPVACPLSPEAAGECNRKTRQCSELSFKSHVFDLGMRDWLFPSLLPVLPELTDVIAKMTAPDEVMRPTFTGLLHQLKCVRVIAQMGSGDDPKKRERQRKRHAKYQRCMDLAMTFVETRGDAQARAKGHFGKHHWRAHPDNAPRPRAATTDGDSAREGPAAVVRQ